MKKKKKWMKNMRRKRKKYERKNERKFEIWADEVNEEWEKKEEIGKKK